MRETAPSVDVGTIVVARDPAFREALLTEGVACLLAGDMETGKALLRDDFEAVDRLRGARPAHRQAAQEPPAHVRPRRQPPGPQPLRDHRLPATARGPAPRGAGRAGDGGGAAAVPLMRAGGSSCRMSIGKREPLASERAANNAQAMKHADEMKVERVSPAADDSRQSL